MCSHILVNFIYFYKYLKVKVKPYLKGKSRYLNTEDFKKKKVLVYINM